VQPFVEQYGRLEAVDPVRRRMRRMDEERPARDEVVVRDNIWFFSVPSAHDRMTFWVIDRAVVSRSGRP
jgi:hypothetical protein